MADEQEQQPSTPALATLDEQTRNALRDLLRAEFAGLDSRIKSLESNSTARPDDQHQAADAAPHQPRTGNREPPRPLPQKGEASGRGSLEVLGSEGEEIEDSERTGGDRPGNPWGSESEETGSEGFAANSGGEEPFSRGWYANLRIGPIPSRFHVPHGITQPRFFSVQDALHSTTFARGNTSTGRLAEADTLYQAIALQHRTLNRLQSVLNDAYRSIEQGTEASELLSQSVAIWQELYGSTEILATRYDILVGLQGDPHQQANASIPEAYASAPACNSALARRAHSKFLAAEVKATTNTLARGRADRRKKGRQTKRTGGGSENSKQKK